MFMKNTLGTVTGATGSKPGDFTKAINLRESCARVKKNISGRIDQTTFITAVRLNPIKKDADKEGRPIKKDARKVQNEEKYKKYKKNEKYSKTSLL